MSIKQLGNSQEPLYPGAIPPALNKQNVWLTSYPLGSNDLLKKSLTKLRRAFEGEKEERKQEVENEEYIERRQYRVSSCRDHKEQN